MRAKRLRWRPRQRGNGGGGLTLLVAGVVLLIFNRRITASVEPAVISKEKGPAKSAAVADKKESIAKKTTRKKSA